MALTTGEYQILRTHNENEWYFKPSNRTGRLCRLNLVFTSLISSLKTEGTFTAISFIPKNSLLTIGERNNAFIPVSHTHPLNTTHTHREQSDATIHQKGVLGVFYKLYHANFTSFFGKL